MFSPHHCIALRKQNALIAALAMVVASMGAARAQSSSQQMQDLQTDAMFLHGALEDIQDQQRQQAAAAQQQAQEGARLQMEAENRANWQMLRAEAARQGYIIDNSGWNPRLVPIAQYRLEQWQKDAVKRPIATTYYPASTHKFAWTTFYERKQGERKRELKRAAKSIGATDWREIERKPYKGVWAIGVEFYR